MSTPERVVFANGIFDLLHDGHRELLMFARAQGTKLIVGINSDRSTKELKGPTRPIQTEQQRKEALEALPFVDEVVVFDDLRTTRIVNEIRPHVVIKGAERDPAEIRIIDQVPDDIEIVLCPLRYDPLGRKISTTFIIEEMNQER